MKSIKTFFWGSGIALASIIVGSILIVLIAAIAEVLNV